MNALKAMMEKIMLFTVVPMHLLWPVILPFFNCKKVDVLLK